MLKPDSELCHVLKLFLHDMFINAIITHLCVDQACAIQYDNNIRMAATHNFTLILRRR